MDKVNDKVSKTLESINLKAGKPKKPEDESEQEHEQEGNPYNTSDEEEESEGETEQANCVPEFSEHVHSIIKEREATITD